MENAIAKVSDLILQEPIENFHSNNISTANKYQAVIEYGRLLSDFSKLVHFVTRMALHHNLVNDKRYIEGGMLYSRNNSEIDLSSISQEIQSVKSRIEILESWGE